MKISTPSFYKEALIKKLYSFLWKLENTGDSNFTKNGELHFIQDLGKSFDGQKFTAFDIGANIGEYTEMLLRYVKTDDVELHLFEPQKSCFTTLAEKFSGRKDILLNNFGLSDSAIEAPLYKNADRSGLASLHKRNLSYYNLKMDDTETISLKTAAEYIKKYEISHINLLKIDIEGHELSALSGFGEFLNPQNVDFIQFEYGGANLDSHTSLLNLFTFLETNGFKLCKMMKNHLEIRSYDPRLENFMYQNWVAVSPAYIEKVTIG